MTRRTPALQNTIRRHNDLLASLHEMLEESGDTYPLPEPLPTEITRLKTTHADALLEDVLAIDPESETQQWMTDASLRASIRALHLKDRCGEERQRLAWEENNLFNWTRHRAFAIRAALNDATGQCSKLSFAFAHTPSVAGLHPFLRQELACLGDLVSGCRDGNIPRQVWLDAVGDVRPPAHHPPPAVPEVLAAPRPVLVALHPRQHSPVDAHMRLASASPPPEIRFHRCDHEYGDALDEDEEGLARPEGDNDDPEEEGQGLFDVLEQLEPDDDDDDGAGGLAVTILRCLSDGEVRFQRGHCSSCT